MDAVLDKVRDETKQLVDETRSTPEKVQYTPQAFTREGRSD